MARNGKKYRQVKDKAPGEVVELDKAVDFLKENATAKFDETVELCIRLCIRLGVDPLKSDQAVRGTTKLPHGSGRDVQTQLFSLFCSRNCSGFRYSWSDYSSEYCTSSSGTCNGTYPITGYKSEGIGTTKVLLGCINKRSALAYNHTSFGGLSN